MVFPEDLGIRRTDATRELLAAKNIADLVTWSDGLYQPLQSLGVGNDGTSSISNVQR